MNIEELKYPIGKFEKPNEVTGEMLQSYISVIAAFPNKIRKEVEALNDSQLDTPYRPDGWTIRQVVNHCADSHMNSLMRLKLTLTEENPTIKPYMEALWAELADSKTMPIEPALKMIEGIHARWTALLNTLTKEQMQRTFVHPQYGITYRLDQNTGMYAWHCNHHLAHITTLKKSKGWK